MIQEVSQQEQGVVRLDQHTLLDGKLEILDEGGTPDLSPIAVERFPLDLLLHEDLLTPLRIQLQLLREGA